MLWFLMYSVSSYFLHNSDTRCWIVALQELSAVLKVSFSVSLLTAALELAENRGLTNDSPPNKDNVHFFRKCPR